MILCFGSKTGVLLNPISGVRRDIRGACITGSEKRSFRAYCDIQGLSPDFDLPFFSLEGKKTGRGERRAHGFGPLSRTL